MSKIYYDNTVDITLHVTTRVDIQCEEWGDVDEYHAGIHFDKYCIGGTRLMDRVLGVGTYSWEDIGIEVYKPKYTPDEFIHYLNLILYNNVCCFLE